MVKFVFWCTLSVIPAFLDKVLVCLYLCQDNNIYLFIIYSEEFHFKMKHKMFKKLIGEQIK